jgi:hypothetical protein
LLLPVLATDCSSDHGALAARPHAAGAAGRAAAGAGGMGRGGALARGGSGGAVVMPPDKHVEPPGRSVFTVVHGVVDADRLAWCFARVRDGKTELVGTPVPEGGMAFGESASFESLPHVNSETDGVVPYVITGDLSLVSGLDCADAVARAASVGAQALDGLAGAGNAGTGNSAEGGAAGAAAGASGAGEGGAPNGGVPAGGGAENGGEIGAAGAPPVVAPPLRAGALPALPAGSLAQGYSLLEVADGCFGAPGFVDPQAEDICGAGYSPNTGTLTGELVTLSRATAEGMLALQALHASRGAPSLGVSANPPADAVQSAITLVDDFSEGALRPVDPRRDQPATAYGVSQRSWNVVASHNGAYEFTEPWLGIEKRSGVSPEDGRGYTLIVIGASYTVPEGDFWHSMAFTLVDNDPGGP